MGGEKFKYISRRTFLFILILASFSFLLLLLITILCVGRQALVFLVPLLCLLYGGILYFGYNWVYKPYRETDKVLKLFSEGYILQGIFEQRCPLTPQSEIVNNKFLEMLNTKELISLSKKQAEYLALQNQINPHFLYNTLEGIRSEALYAGMDHVAKMTEALATFFRYTISNVENLVTLEDELVNIKNYYIIQQYRFGERLNLQIEVDQEHEDQTLKYRLPKLTLQPIAENSIYHGIERKIGKGTLRIKIETTANRLLITVSDDGMGMQQEQVDTLNDKLRTTSLDDVQPKASQRGGIAVVNVNNRIKLLFGDQYGIYINSHINVGTDVEITLPLIWEQQGGS